MMPFQTCSMFSERNIDCGCDYQGERHSRVCEFRSLSKEGIVPTCAVGCKNAHNNVKWNSGVKAVIKRLDTCLAFLFYYKYYVQIKEITRF